MFRNTSGLIKTKQKRTFWKIDQGQLINEANTDTNKVWKSIEQMWIKQDIKPVIPWRKCLMVMAI